MASEYIFNYPIETPEAIEFWSSEHKCNTAKAFIAFCLDEANFEELAKRHGYTREWRDRMWAAFSMYVNTPSMSGIPFSEIETPYWECMPNINAGTELEHAPYIVALTPSYSEIPLNSSFSISVVATGAPIILYQWFKDDVLILGATSSLYTLNPFTEADNGVYHVAATNSYGATLSKKIDLSAKIPKPVITQSPTDQSVETGTNATFTADATGYTSVQWFEQGIALPGEDTTTLVVTADHTASGNSGHNYSAQFRNSGGVETTHMAELLVTTPIPTITLQPVDVTTGLGDTNVLVLEADASNYDTVQWFKKNRLTGHFVPVAGQITTTFTETVSYTGFFDEYYAEFTNQYHTVRTRVSTVYVAVDPVVLMRSFNLGFSDGFN